MNKLSQLRAKVCMMGTSSRAVKWVGVVFIVALRSNFV